MILSRTNVTYRAVVNKTKIYLPARHIKLGLIKVFVKTINKGGEGVNCLKANVSAHKSGQDKRRHFRRSSSTTAFSKLRLQNKVNAADRRAWVAFENVCSNF
jgi:hypothetical protein